MITSGVTLVMANLVDLSSMSTMGSAGFLVIFAAVNLANAALAKDTGSKRWLSLIGAGLCLGALGSLIWYTAQHAPGHLWVLVGMAGTAFLIEAIYRLVTKRAINLPKDLV